MDLRLAVYSLWAIASVVIWGLVFMDDLNAFRAYPGARAKRELIGTAALFLAALASGLALLVLVIGQDIPGIRGFFVAIALGAFLGAGIVRKTVGRRAE